MACAVRDLDLTHMVVPRLIDFPQFRRTVVRILQTSRRLRKVV